MKKFKKLVTLIMSGIISLSTVYSPMMISAENIDNDSTKNNPKTIYSEKIDDFNEYCQTVLPGYLSLAGRDVFDLSVSEPITIYDWDDGLNNKTAVFVLDEDEIVGQLTVSEYNGRLYSSYAQPDYLDQINKAYKSRVAFSIGNYEDCLIISCDKYSNVLMDTNDEKSANDVLYMFNNNMNVEDTFSSLSVSEKSIINEESSNLSLDKNTQTRSYTFHMTSTPIVANGTNTANNKGLCWAACVASLTNYKKGMHYTAFDVLNKCWQTTGYSTTNIPVGNNYWIALAYSLYNVTLTYNAETALGGFSVYARMYEDKPIHISLKGTKTTSTGTETIRHSVVIAGAAYGGIGDGYYLLMDPNVSGSYVTVYVDSNAWTDPSYFVYSPSTNKTYNEWKKSRY